MEGDRWLVVFVVFFLIGKRCHILPDEFSKHTEQGGLSFHLKGHASFNP